MADVKITKFIEVLTTTDRNTQLQAVQNLKKIFQPPDKIFSKLKLESVLQNARISLESKKPEVEFLHSYGISLANFISTNTTFNPEVLHQVKLILGELQDEKLNDELITKLWSQLEKNSSHPDWALDASKPIIERTVLEWVVDVSNNRMQCFSKMSANSPKLFQTVTSILYEVLVRTKGHVRVFEVTSLFIEAVKRECKIQGRCFLELYPRGCRRLVSLMRCPPSLCSSSDIGKNVIELLSKMYLTDRKRALILLSHFTEWVCVFKVYLEEGDNWR